MGNLKVFIVLLILFILVSCGIDPQFSTSSIPTPIEPLKLEGCKNTFASNYSEQAVIENGTCQFKGCAIFDEQLRMEYEKYRNTFPNAAQLSSTCPAAVSDVFKQKSIPHVGILWVMDNSFSMEEEQKNLGNNFSSFINQFINSQLDFTMGITTTDNDHSSLSLSKLTSDAARANKGKFIQDFKNMIKVGTNGSSDERGYEASYEFLESYSGQLLKQDSHLVVIYVSDEADQSSKSGQFYLDHMSSYVNNASKVRTHAILDLNNSGGDDDSGGKKYLYSVQKTGGISGDIDSNFATILTKIGDNLVPLQSTFHLNKIPYLPSLEVKVNGTLSLSWKYDSTENSVIVSPAPTFNSEIVINYIPRN
jgi:hypothetical protein